MNDIIAAERLLLGKEPNIQAGEGYLYQYFNFEAGEIQIEDENGKIILTRPVNMIRKGLQTDYGKIVVAAGGKVYFDTRQIASAKTVNRYILQKSIFSKFRTPKLPKPPKLDAPAPTETTQNAQDSQTSAEPTIDTPKAPEAPKQPKFVPGQERPGHKYIKRVPDPKNPGKYIYYYQEDIDAENRRDVYFNEEGKKVKAPVYDNKYHEQRHQGEDWKPVKKVGLWGKLTGDRTQFINELADGVKLYSDHSNRGYSYLWLQSKHSGQETGIHDGEDMHEYVQDQLARKEYVTSTDDEIQVGEDASYTDDGEGGNKKTTHGIVVYNPGTKKYRYIEGNTEAAYDDYYAKREGSNPAAQWLLDAWKRHDRDKQKWDNEANGQPAPQATEEQPEPEQPTQQETPGETPPESAQEGQDNDYYKEGNKYTINGFTGTLTAKQGRVGILKDGDGNLRLFKLEHFEVTPYEAPENAPEEKPLPQFKTYKEYQDYHDSERRAKNEQLIRRMKAGGVRYRKTPEEIEAEEKAAAEKERIRQESLSKNRELMEGEGYKTGRQEVENRGFTIGNNEFIATKEVEARNYKFTLKAEFNPSTGEWNRSLYKAPYNTVEVDGERHSIEDMNQDGVFYRAVEMPEPSMEMDMFGGDEAPSTEPREVTKFISYDELEEKNGKRLFEKTAASKGLVSSKDAEDVLFPDDEEEKAVWEIVELDDLIASHKLDGSENPLYTNKEVQNRDRKLKRTQAQITKIASNMDFRKLSPDGTYDAGGGAPIVDQDYEVVAGNGRVLGIEKHIKEMGRTDYREALLNRAEKLGFDRSEVEKMENPVAVRRLNVSKERAIRLGILSNKDDKLALSEAEETRGYARLIEEKASQAVANEINEGVEKLKEKHMKAGGSLEKFNPTTSEILDQAGYNIYRAFLKHGVISDNEANKFYDADNKQVNSAHKTKMTNVLTHYLLGDEPSRFWENAYDKTRISVQQSLGSLLQLKGTEHDLSPEIGEVIKLQGALRESNKKREEEGKKAESPENYLLQLKADMFSESNISPEVEKMFIAMHYANQRKTREMLNQYNQAVQGDLFTEKKPKDELINDIFGGRHSEDPEEEVEEPEVKPAEGEATPQEPVIEKIKKDTLDI